MPLTAVSRLCYPFLIFFSSSFCPPHLFARLFYFTRNRRLIIPMKFLVKSRNTIVRKTNIFKLENLNKICNFDQTQFTSSIKCLSIDLCVVCDRVKVWRLPWKWSELDCTHLFMYIISVIIVETRDGEVEVMKKLRWGGWVLECKLGMSRFLHDPVVYEVQY